MKKKARILLKPVDKRENFYPFSKNDKKVNSIKSYQINLHLIIY